MFRHSVRQIVQPGQYPAFLEAVNTFNAAAPNAGLPSYRLWRTVFGDLNEVWAEADYDSFDSHVHAWDQAQRNDTLMTAFRKMISLTVPGTIHDYPLQPIDS